MIRIGIVRRLREPRIDATALRDAAVRFAAAAEPLARRRGAVWPAAADVLLVGDRASAAAHRSANGADGPTDAITLLYAATPAEPARAEILLDPLVARRAAAARDPDTLLPEERGLPWDGDLELALYLAHAFDHLAGSDDATPAGYRAMRRRELRWLASLPSRPRFFRPE